MLGKVVLRWIFGVALGMAAVNAWSATQIQIDNARARGLWWLFAHQSGDGSWGNSSNAAVASTASTLEALFGGAPGSGAIIIAFSVRSAHY
jgi:hypothetical protein